MTILIAALVFGGICLLLLSWNLGLTFGPGVRGPVSEKVRSVVKLILLLEVMGFIALFVAVLVKTMML